ncbi:MAG: hypothetical protein K2Y29_07070 [Beijerinckiaceae bacterium]|nr:hypothetical protein [Beijerinckiaceae bacterium]
MSSIKSFTLVGFLAAAAVFSAAPSNAMGLAAGAATTRAAASDTNILNVQYRERAMRPGVRNNVVRRAPVARNTVVVRRNAYNRRAVAAGVGAVAAVGVIGAVAAANARPRQQYYYEQGYYPAAAPVYAQPRCRVRSEELYNRNGVYRGVFQVQDCR